MMVGQPPPAQYQPNGQQYQANPYEPIGVIPPMKKYSEGSLPAYSPFDGAHYLHRSLLSPSPVDLAPLGHVGHHPIPHTITAYFRNSIFVSIITFQTVSLNSYNKH